MRERLVEGGYTRNQMSRDDLIATVAMLEQNQTSTGRAGRSGAKDKDSLEGKSNSKGHSNRWKGKGRPSGTSERELSPKGNASSTPDKDKHTTSDTRKEPYDKSKSKCNKCGKFGHWAKEC
jgi:hypothetical protein